MEKSSIFIHGILRRSGTNFLNQLLLLHPALVQTKSKIRENWFLSHSDHLLNYYEALDRLWSNPKWGGVPHSKNEFLASIGTSHLEYLRKNGIKKDQIILTKTRDVKNLKNFNFFFPSGKLIILIRSPFDVAASSYKTWEKSTEMTMKEWNDGVKAINDFEVEDKNKEYLMLRYEDILANPIVEIKKCLNYLELDEDSYNWEEVEALPVFFSSEQGENFKIQVKTEHFSPQNRWKSLTDEEQKKLEKGFSPEIASYFGYGENGEVLKLPSLSERLTTKLPINKKVTIPNTNNVSTLTRRQHFKNGLKSLYCFIKG